MSHAMMALMIDDEVVLIGSDNMYFSPLAEFSFVIEGAGHELSGRVTERRHHVAPALRRRVQDVAMDLDTAEMHA